MRVSTCARHTGDTAGSFMPLTPQQRDAFLASGFVQVQMKFLPQALARMRSICTEQLAYKEVIGGSHYRVHDLIAHGRATAPTYKPARELVRLCRQRHVKRLFAEALGVDGHELVIPDVFLIRMGPGGEIGMHTHRCTLSAAMVLVADSGGVHLNVDWRTGVVHEHTPAPGWAMLNLGRTPHAVGPVYNDRISIVWNAICPTRPTLGLSSEAALMDSRLTAR